MFKKLVKTLLVASFAITSGLTAYAGGHAQKITEFRVGILGGENQADRLRRTKCFVDKAEALLGVPTKVFAPADYNGVIEGLIGGNLDMAWLGASGYAKVYLADPNIVEPVLSIVGKKGNFGYYALGFARKDSGIENLADMKGKQFAFGDPNSTSGYLIPSIEIPDLGYSMEPGEHFSDVVFSGGHEQTIVGVYNGDYDAGVSWSGGTGDWEDGYDYGAFRLASDSGLVDMTEMVEIWRSKIIPEGPIVLRKTLPEKVKIQITALFAGLSSMDPECAYSFGAGEIKGMISVSHEDYESIVAARKAKIGG